MLEKDQVHRALDDHRAFMVRVARELCGEHLAEDAVQEASLRALLRPPRHAGALRAWLRRAVIHTSLELLRSEARRRRREQAVARPVVKEPDEGRRFLREAIERSLAELREPYRTVFRLRLHEELSVSAIAARTGVTAETVRSQLKRGRALLRADLDRRLGDRRRWTVALLSWARAPKLAPRRTSRLARRLPRYGLVPLALTLGGVVLWTAWPADRARAEGPGPIASEAPVDRVAAIAPDDRSTPPRSPVVLSRSVVESGAATALSGRCVDEGGRPVPDADVYLLPAGSLILTQPYEDHALARARTNVEGRFRFETAIAPLLVVASGEGPSTTREVARVGIGGESVELELVLVPAERVRGAVVDESSAPVPAAEVQLFVLSSQPLAAVRPEGARVRYRRDLPLGTVADERGEFELLQPAGVRRGAWAHHAGLPDGSAAVAAPEPTWVWLADEQEVDVGARTPDGEPLAGVLVEVFVPNAHEPRVGVTGEDGTCRIAGVSDTRYLMARLSRADLATQVSFPRGVSNYGMTMRLKRERPGRVVGSDGVGVADARVEASDLEVVARATAAGFEPAAARSLARVWEATSGADGRFVAPGYNGELNLLVTPPERYAPTAVVLSQPEQAVEVLVKECDERYRVEGTVRTLGGAPVRSFRVRELRLGADGRSAGPWRTSAGGNGSFVWEGVGDPPREFELDAVGLARTFVPGVCDGPEVSVRAELPEARNVELRFVDALGAPLAYGDTIWTTCEGDPLLFPQGTGYYQSRLLLDRNGSVRIAGAPARPGACRLEAPGFSEPFEIQVDLSAAEAGPIEVRVAANLEGARRSVRVELSRKGREPELLRLRVTDGGATRS